MKKIGKFLTNPKVYVALGVVIMFVGCVIGKHDYSPRYTFPNPVFYKSALCLFGGYALMALFTIIDAKKLKKP